MAFQKALRDVALLVVAIVLVCAGCGDTGSRSKQSKEQVFTHLRSLGVEVIEPGSLYSISRTDFSIIGGYSKVGNDDVKLLKNVKNVSYVVLAGTEVSDEIIDTLAGMPKLSYLDLSYTKITGKGFKSLAKLKDLDRINLSGCKIGKESLEELRGLRGVLSLFDVEADEQDMIELGKVSKDLVVSWHPLRTPDQIQITRECESKKLLLEVNPGDGDFGLKGVHFGNPKQMHIHVHFVDGVKQNDVSLLLKACHLKHVGEISFVEHSDKYNEIIANLSPVEPNCKVYINAGEYSEEEIKSLLDRNPKIRVVFGGSVTRKPPKSAFEAYGDRIAF